jgi:hypothetical protein
MSSFYCFFANQALNAIVFIRHRNNNQAWLFINMTAHLLAASNSSHVAKLMMAAEEWLDDGSRRMFGWRRPGGS